MSNKSLSYRPDIDGLRALAVLAVVIFHFNKQWLPGGFVGVDIFFVISGFLITGIVSRQVAKKEFSFAEFYSRRIRRILPAAFIMTLVTLLFGTAFMLPGDVQALSKSAIASVLSAANIYFWLFLDTNYFAASSDTVPLLHMWSLGVEEQFYLIWPGLMLIAYRFGGRKLLLSIAGVLAIASFIVGEYFITRDQSFAYYMLPSRAGELLFGGMLFVIIDGLRNQTPRWLAECMGLLGLALIVWSLAFLSETGGFPGLRSIIPTLGAGLMIASGSFGGGVVTRSLAMRPAVAIGLVSFSLYLWHWPVLAFYRYAYGDLTLSGTLICAALLVILALLSYFYVEKPFRLPTSTFRNKALPSIVAASILGFSAFTLIQDGIIHSMSPSNYAEKIQANTDLTNNALTLPYVCQSNFKADFFESKKCLIGTKTDKPSVLVFGDSNAAHYVGYLDVIARQQGISARNVEHHACVPFEGAASKKYINPGYYDSCEKYNAEVRKRLSDYDTIIVGASWGSYAQRSTDFYNDFDAMLKGLAATNKKIIVALKAPTFPAYDGQCKNKALKIPNIDCEKRSAYDFKGESRENKHILSEAKKYANVSTLAVADIICKNNKCSAYIDGTPAYFDGGHLSAAGSIKMGEIRATQGLGALTL